MVVLTLVAQKNGETIYFEDPIPEASYARLLSCSFYNSWHNLRTVGRMFLKQTGEVILSLPEGHYNVESIEKELKASFEFYKNVAKLAIETHKPNSVLTITNWETKPKEISVDWSLSNLLGIGRKLGVAEYVKKLNSPSCYFIYCDLIDPTKNFLNGKKSKLLAKVDVRGKPYERVSYFMDSSQNVFRDTSSDKYINSVTLTVKDENGDLFDFHNFPLIFELEIN